MKFENFDNYEIPMNQRYKKPLIVIYVSVWRDEGLDETFLDDSRDIIYTSLIIHRNVRRVSL